MRVEHGAEQNSSRLHHHPVERAQQAAPPTPSAATLITPLSAVSALSTASLRASSNQNVLISRMLQAQQTSGNRALQRMLRSQHSDGGHAHSEGSTPDHIVEKAPIAPPLLSAIPLSDRQTATFVQRAPQFDASWTRGMYNPLSWGGAKLAPGQVAQQKEITDLWNEISEKIAQLTDPKLRRPLNKKLNSYDRVIQYSEVTEVTDALKTLRDSVPASTKKSGGTTTEEPVSDETSHETGGTTGEISGSSEVTTDETGTDEGTTGETPTDATTPGKKKAKKKKAKSDAKPDDWEARANAIESLVAPVNELNQKAEGVPGENLNRSKVLQMLTLVGQQQVIMWQTASKKDFEAAEEKAKRILAGATLKKATDALKFALKYESPGTKDRREKAPDIKRDVALLKHKTSNAVVKSALDLIDAAGADHRTYNLPKENTNAEAIAAQQEWEALGPATAKAIGPDVQPTDVPAARSSLINLHAPGGANGVKAKLRGSQGVQTNAVMAAGSEAGEILIHIHAGAAEEARLKKYWQAQRNANRITDDGHVYLRDVPATFVG